MACDHDKHPAFVPSFVLIQQLLAGQLNLAALASSRTGDESSAQNGVQVFDLSQVSWEKLVKYDSQHFPCGSPCIPLPLNYGYGCDYFLSVRVHLLVKFVEKVEPNNSRSKFALRCV